MIKNIKKVIDKIIQQILKLKLELKKPPIIGQDKSPIEINKLIIAETISLIVF